MAALVRFSSSDDLSYLSDHLRLADRKELEAHGVPPLPALTMGFQSSLPCYTIEHGGTPIAMFGVAPRDEDIGFIWLLGTDEISTISRQFLRESRDWLEKISSPYKMVCNMVHEENTVHIKWLKFLGFTFLKHTKPFIEFARITT